MKTIFVVSVAPTVPNSKPEIFYCESVNELADAIFANRYAAVQITSVCHLDNSKSTGNE